MLVLSRKKNESVQIGSTIRVTVISVGKGRVKLGISAPDDVRILRSELTDPPPGAAAAQPEALRHEAELERLTPS